MPELPEVETIRKQLNKETTGLKIVDIWTDVPKMVRPSLPEVLKRVKGQEITGVERRGKHLIIRFAGKIIFNKICCIIDTIIIFQ